MAGEIPDEARVVPDHERPRLRGRIEVCRAESVEAIERIPAENRPVEAGTLKEIERASVADLGKVPGISAESARKIFDFFHARPG